MGRGIKQKNLTLGTAASTTTSVASISVTIVAATVAAGKAIVTTIAPPPSGTTATAQAYVETNSMFVSVVPTGTATVAYLATMPFVIPLNAGAVTAAQYFPQLATPMAYASGITGVTGTAGQVSLDAFGIQLIKGTSITILGASTGGLVSGQTYFVLADNAFPYTSAQLTDTYANAIAGVAALTTTVSATSTDFNLGADASPNVDFVNRSTGGKYITAPVTAGIPMNISGGGQGLTFPGTSFKLLSVDVINPGSGYAASPPPAVTLSVPAGGSPGSAQANMAPISVGASTGLSDVGFNPFSYLTNPVIPAGMTSAQYLGIVGGGFGGTADATNPTVACTAWIPGAAAEDNAYLIEQKGATRYLVAGQTTYAASTMVAGKTYIIASVGTTLWSNYGASTNAVVGDVFTATAPGTGTGTVAFAGTCTLANQAATAVTLGNMQITVTANSSAFRASKMTNKFVWDFTSPQPIRYSADFFVGSAATVNTAKSGAEADTFANGTGNLVLGQVNDYTS